MKKFTIFTLLCIAVSTGIAVTVYQIEQSRTSYSPEVIQGGNRIIKAYQFFVDALNHPTQEPLYDCSLLNRARFYYSHSALNLANVIAHSNDNVTPIETQIFSEGALTQATEALDFLNKQCNP